MGVDDCNCLATAHPEMWRHSVRRPVVYVQVCSISIVPTFWFHFHTFFYHFTPGAMLSRLATSPMRWHSPFAFLTKVQPRCCGVLLNVAFWITTLGLALSGISGVISPSRVNWTVALALQVILARHSFVHSRSFWLPEWQFSNPLLYLSS